MFCRVFCAKRYHSQEYHTDDRLPVEVIAKEVCQRCYGRTIITPHAPVCRERITSWKMSLPGTMPHLQTNITCMVEDPALFPKHDQGQFDFRCDVRTHELYERWHCSIRWCCICADMQHINRGKGSCIILLIFNSLSIT